MFNEKLRQLRSERGLRLKDVSEAVGVSIHAISNYEQGIREPSFAVLVRLCKFFGVSADYLLGLTDDN